MLIGSIWESVTLLCMGYTTNWCTLSKQNFLIEKIVKRDVVTNDVITKSRILFLFVEYFFMNFFCCHTYYLLGLRQIFSKTTRH